jgi:putative CocE/NonD family hydrolase
MGAERWRTAEDWPPPAVRRRLYLAEGGRLSPDAPSAPDARDRYVVDRDASTGSHTRWDTLIGRALRTPYPDRADQAARLQVYDSVPLEQAIEVTGHPRVRLHVTSTATDGAFFAYLEDVWPDGRVVYVTEGQLRALHRRTHDAPAGYWTPGPAPSFRRADAAPLEPGVPTIIEFELLPTSYEFRAGHRLRLSLAGADRGHFAAVPELDQPAPVVEFLRGRDAASWLEFPDATGSPAQAGASSNTGPDEVCRCGISAPGNSDRSSPPPSSQARVDCRACAISAAPFE